MTRPPIGRPSGKPSLEQLLLSRIDKGDGAGCWPWTGTLWKQGYGRLKHKGRAWFAHRLAYQVWNGKLRPRQRVRHTCDNPPCCRPDHLVKGTQAQNLRDMVLKDRQARGERSPFARLTDGDVLMIRASRLTGVALARQLGVSETTVSRARRRRSWKHLLPKGRISRAR